MSEQEDQELAGPPSLSECLLCLSYGTNYCERTEREENPNPILMTLTNQLD